MKHPWEPEWKTLLHWLHRQVDPESWTCGGLDRSRAVCAVAVSGDRGLGLASDDADYAAKPVRPAGWVNHQPVWWLCPSRPSLAGSRRGVSHDGRVAVGVHVVGLLVRGTTTAGTSSPTCPQVAEAAWYGLRMWIEHGFEQFKSGGWQWQKSRMTDRIEPAGCGWRSRWRRGGSCRWEARRTPGEVRSRPPLPWKWVAREWSGVERGARAATALGAAPGFAASGQCVAQGLGGRAGGLVMGRGVVLGSWCPEPWPHIPPGIQVEYHEPNPDLVGKKTYPCEGAAGGNNRLGSAISGLTLRAKDSVPSGLSTQPFSPDSAKRLSNNNFSSTVLASGAGTA